MTAVMDHRPVVVPPIRQDVVDVLVGHLARDEPEAFARAQDRLDATRAGVQSRQGDVDLHSAKDLSLAATDVGGRNVKLDDTEGRAAFAPLDVLAVGDEEALALGLDVTRVRLLLVGLALLVPAPAALLGGAFTTVTAVATMFAGWHRPADAVAAFLVVGVCTMLAISAFT